MSQLHAEKILDKLHDQYLKGIDCDVILRSADHLGENSVTSNPPEQGFDIAHFYRLIKQYLK